MFSKAKRAPSTALVTTADRGHRGGRPPGPPSIIAGGVRVTGNIRSDGEVHVEGRVDGDVDALALTVGEHGHVVGHIDVDDAVIYGIVSGTIRARRVRLARSSKVIAEITHDILSIDEGASFEGQCRRVAIDADRRGDRHLSPRLTPRLAGRATDMTAMPVTNLPMLHLIAAFLIGSTLGAVVQRTHFCTMGAIADVVLFGSTRRLRAWILALAVALAGTQLLEGLGLVEVTDDPRLWAPAGWAGTAVGGLAFGFGMVLAGGCIGRSLVRVGAGSLKALTVVLIAGLLAACVWHGLLAPLADGLASLTPATLPAPLGGAILPGLTLAAALAAFCFVDASFRRARRDVAAGLLLGLLPPLTWLLAAPRVDESSELGLSFAIPTAAALDGLVGGSTSGFAISLVAGTIFGSFAMARRSGQFRVEAFSATDDMQRHIVGAALMGIGGGLAAGCTIGHGITGLAALAPASLVATSAMVAGAVWALSWLQTGRLMPFAARAANDA